MSMNTRERLLVEAKHQFSSKGFSGVSIDQIAAAQGVTKQALLYHFGSKRKLYGEILKGVSDRLVSDAVQVRASTENPAEQLEALILNHLSVQLDSTEEAKLLMRELLDNQERAEHAANWFLKPYLDDLVSILLRIEGKGDLTPSEALATVYQFIGAANYIAVSKPTLKQMFGKKALSDMEYSYPEQLRLLIRARLSV